jgi:outer membrane protein assembly factor BamD
VIPDKAKKILFPRNPFIKGMVRIYFSLLPRIGTWKINSFFGSGIFLTINLNRLSVVCAIIMAVVLSQDVSGALKKRFECGKSVQRAMEKYKKKHYNEAKTILTEAKYQCSGSPLMDTLLYYLGKADVMLKLPSEARIEFERLIQDFPTSPFSDESHYLLGYCSFVEANPPERDQEKTHKAIRELTDFIDRYPESSYIDSAKKYIERSTEILAQKEFANARFYEKIEQYDAAIVYFKSLIAEFPQSKYIDQAKLSIAQNLIALSRPGEARPILDDLVTSVPDTNDINQKAVELIGRIEKSKQIEVPEKSGRKKTRQMPESRKRVSSESNADKGDSAQSAAPDAMQPERKINSAIADTSTAIVPAGLENDSNQNAE